MPERNLKGKFALIAHPADLELYRKYIHFLKPDKTFRDELLLKLFEWTPSYKVKEWNDYSLDNKSADGIFVMVPFLPEMREIRLHKIIEKIEQAFTIAKNEHCTVAALGAFTSIVLQGQEENYSQKYGLRLTSGNSFTVTLIIKSVLELAALFKIDLSSVTLSIIGASGDIGSGCMIYFGDKVKKLHLTARGMSKLKEVVEKNKSHLKCEIELTVDNHKAAKGSNIIILATSSYDRIFNINDFNAGTIVCDASAPLNVNYNSHLREDVFLYHGGIARLSNPFEIGFDIGIAPPYTMYGCLTEGILHSMYDDLPLSLGRGFISSERINTYINLLQNKSEIKPAFTIDKHEYTGEELAKYADIFNHGKRVLI